MQEKASVTLKLLVVASLQILSRDVALRSRPDRLVHSVWTLPLFLPSSVGAEVSLEGPGPVLQLLRRRVHKKEATDESDCHGQGILGTQHSIFTVHLTTRRTVLDLPRSLVFEDAFWCTLRGKAGLK